MIKRIVLLIVLATLFGCSDGSAAPVETTLHLGGLGGKPTAINPLVTTRSISVGLLDLIFSRLVRLNKDMLPEPGLAESWDISDDGLIYTFHLRKGVRFHDGIELSAADCKFTYQLASDPAGECYCRHFYDDVAKWEVVDKYTFKVTLKEPYASFLYLMTCLYIMPKHLLEGKDTRLTAVGQVRTAEFNQHPVGTGPFRFFTPSPFPSPSRGEGRERVSNNDSVILEANPDYYEGRPAIDKIIATGYDEPSKYWAAFMRGENDVAFYLSKEDFETAKRDSAFKTYTSLFIWPYGIEYNPDHLFFQDKNIRKALAYAIDTKEIIAKAEKGYGVPATGPFLPGFWSCNPDIKPIEYNPQKALELLKEQGWSLNKNGVLERTDPIRSAPAGHTSNGAREFRFNLLVNNEMRDLQMIAYLIYQHLLKIGIRINLVPYEPKKAGEEKYKQAIQEGGAYLSAFVIITGSGDLVPDYWHSQRQGRAGLLWQHPNAEIDRLLELGQKTHKLAERQKIYYEAHRLIAEEQPVTFLHFFYNLGAVNTRFTNTDSLFSTAMPFWTIKDWRVSKNIRASE